MKNADEAWEGGDSRGQLKYGKVDTPAQRSKTGISYKGSGVFQNIPIANVPIVGVRHQSVRSGAFRRAFGYVMWGRPRKFDSRKLKSPLQGQKRLCDSWR
jgi:hypothetical protein